MQPDNDSMITLGKINGVFGVKGWMKVYSYTAEQNDILSYKNWYLQQDGQWQKVKLLKGQRQGKGIVASIEGIVDRDQALALQGTLIGTLREALPKLSNDQFYWSDLAGLSVVTVDGQQLGEISHLFETGANDVMVVKGDRERWLPWLMNDVVKLVDLNEGIVQVDWDPDF
uniref:Ribosome maturation factor RimM n=1 Tax=uncultured Thiotrichaceae bacterium TaxID=298394 RepID=A0A6S6U873_9GAMM|nr:MAG: 16S rRNA processing protein RimM [uncultured Thiotrichaceae bacterium]